MKKITILTLSLVFVCTLCFAQAAKDEHVKEVGKFTEGAVLTDAQVGFINVLTKAAPAKARGAAQTNEAMIGKTKFTVGYTLTKADVAAIDAKYKALKDAKAGSAEPKNAGKVRSADWCWYWYYYCDAYGYCRYYKYWYYC